jgi:two-component system LytT family response regulator
VSDAIRALIVDDEPLARRGLRLHLERASGFDVVGEAATAAEAVACIARLTPQVVFLDVRMPGDDGFSVVEKVGLDAMPITVFVTAYDDHALRAFDAHAVDYLLKPIDPARFARTVERVRTLVGGRSTAQRLLLRDGRGIIFVDGAEIDWVQAEGDYVRVYVRGRGHLVRHTLAAMEERLEHGTFARIHRSAIVNVARVRELRAGRDRTASLILRNGTVLRVSRGYCAKLRALLRCGDSRDPRGEAAGDRDAAGSGRRLVRRDVE